MREMQKRAIIEYENGIFIREYSSCKEAGDVLDVNYKLINNVLRRKVKYIKQYPNKTWIYKDGQEVHSMRKNNKSAWKKGLFKKVIQTSLDDKIIAIFLSIDDAAEKLNICRNTVINNCNNYTVKCIKLNCKFKYE